MDEARFRQLLAQHWSGLFDSRTIAQGAEYARRGRVRATHYEAGDGEGALVGTVDGGAVDPYVAGVRIRGDGNAARLDCYCSCPLRVACKHVAATVLTVLRGAGVQLDPAASTPLSGELGAWKKWLDGLPAGQRTVVTAATAQKRAPQAAAASMVIVLRIEANALLPGLLAAPVCVTAEGRVAPAAVTPSADRDDDAKVLSGGTGEERADLADLRERPRHGDAHVLRDAADARLLDDLLAALPFCFEKVNDQRLRHGPTRALRIGWDARENGTQKLVLAIDGADATAQLARVGGLWYVDTVGREIGRVDGEPRLAEAVLRAPPLLPEQVPALMQRWQDTPLLAALPLPHVGGAIEQRRGAPTPMLTLRSVEARGVNGFGDARYRAGVARLSFDYDGIDLPAVPAAPRERRRVGTTVVEIVRDRGAEISAQERLEDIGLVAAELFAPTAGIARDAFGTSDFVIEHGRNGVAGVDQLFALAPRLRDLGFRLASDQGFPFDLLDEPDAWYADISEAGNAWFDLRLGIDIGGRHIDLLPVLQRLLTDPHFPLAPRKGEADDAVWLVPIDARHRAPLPLAKLRELIEPLMEWLQGATSVQAEDGALRLHRAQAIVLDELPKGDALPWRGGEALRQEMAALREHTAPIVEPAGFRATLRPYQREGLAWLDLLARAALGGILADDMGLGKTVQVLAHLLAEKNAGRLAEPVLIVAPTSLVANWRDEAARFAPELSVLVLHGAGRAARFDDIPAHDIVITTYPLLPRDEGALATHAFALLVLDEAQAIKNAKSLAAKSVRKLRARRRLAMTGTPLENHLGELWAEFDAVEPGLLGHEKDFTRFYRTPIEKHGNVEQRERLQRRIAPLLLRRRKEDVLADLPAKTDIVRKVELDGAQRELYETLRLTQHERVLDEVRKRGLAQSGIVVLDALLKLRQVCCDPRLVKLDSARHVVESAKLELLLGLLENLVAEDRRVLVFSQFAEMLALIGAALDARGLAWQSLTGQTPAAQRGDLVARFQNGGVPLFLISLKAGGVGLNLTAADTVIHYDPWWNPAVERQATDRAHRIGQDKPVFVYKLICEGTVEEKIQAMQQRKAELAHALLDGADAATLRFDPADLAELFAPLDG